MLDFNLEEYQEKETNTKIKAFIRFLYEKCGNGSLRFDNSYFSLLTEDDLIESLKTYILNSKITAQVTANNYISFITRFFNELSRDYNIKNDVFANIDQRTSFQNKAKEIISELKTVETKGIATDEQYEDLIEGIKQYLEKFSYDKLCVEIDNYRNNLNENLKNYHRYISILATKLILKYALKSKIVISLDISDLDIENRILNIKNIALPLDDELIKLFYIYLRLRAYVFNLYPTQENKLFVKFNGMPYITISNSKKPKTDYYSFFTIMQDTVKTEAADLFAFRRILEMLDKGVDIFTVLKITERKSETIFKLIDDKNNQNEINKKINKLFIGDTNIDKKYSIKKKGNLFVTCPFCGNTEQATNDNWILAQFENNGEMYLACRKCRGENGTGFL